MHSQILGVFAHMRQLPLSMKDLACKAETAITPISSKAKLLLAGSQRCAATVQSNMTQPPEMSSGVTPPKGQIYWSYSCLGLFYLGDGSLEITTLILNVV